MIAGGMEAAERTVEPESLDAQLPLGAQEFGASASIDNAGRLREHGGDRSAAARRQRVAKPSQPRLGLVKAGFNLLLFSAGVWFLIDGITDVMVFRRLS